jgi:hypothetical protein
MDINFTDRTSYLAFRAEWKSSYKILSQDIRTAKLAFKDAERAFSRHETNSGLVEKLRTTLQNFRSQANSMLADLQDAKVYAAELRAERLANATNDYCA